MAYVRVIRCNRCGQPCRNDGTAEKSVWVCNNSQKPCVKYKPPVEPEPVSEDSKQDITTSAKES